MIRLREIKVPAERIKRDVPYEEQIRPEVAHKLGVTPDDILSMTVRRHAIDARKKPRIYDVFTVDVGLAKGVRPHCKGNVMDAGEAEVSYVFPERDEELPYRPVIAGFGPAGIFCAYELALHGCRPIVLERGSDSDTRVQDVERFWKEGVLHPESNVQFGEGGAGTFSDGKLNSRIKDKTGRIGEVLKVLVEHGAPPEILYEAEPHIGTDLLRDVVKRIREHIIALGGEVRFHTKLIGIEIAGGRVCAVTVGQRDRYNGPLYRIETDTLVLAIGHSARDTFLMLRDAGVAMEPKAFAVGLRVLHPQDLIDAAQYGVKRDVGQGDDGNGVKPDAEQGEDCAMQDWERTLPPAAYKLTHQTAYGRGVYSFCMCPGGYVVNASSEEGMLCVNGMSDHARDSGSANSAIVVQVRPEDYAAYGDDDVLAGMYFQRELERRAYEIGQGAVPVETWGEFSEAVTGTRVSQGDRYNDSLCTMSHLYLSPLTRPCPPDSADRLTIPYIKGRYRFAPVHDILPAEFNQCIIEGMNAFGRKLKGCDAPDTLLAGVESRTSSPVRIVRDENMQSINVRGLYPAGEGAGYAGGIMSAAVDGIKVAERINHEFNITTDR